MNQSVNRNLFTPSPLTGSGKPYTRWWWFSGEINAEDVRIPEYWCRTGSDEAWLFLARPKTRELAYPMRYGQSFCDRTQTCHLRVNLFGKSHEIVAVYEPYQSLLLRFCRDGKVNSEDFPFVPREPRVGE